MVHLTLDDIDWTQQAIRIDQGKGRRLLLDSRGVDVPMAYNPTLVMPSSLNLLGQIPRSWLRLLQRCSGRWHERLSADKAQRLVVAFPYCVSSAVSTGPL